MNLEKLHIKDNANSKEEFQLIKVKEGVYKTEPKPGNLKKYYEFVKIRKRLMRHLQKHSQNQK